MSTLCRAFRRSSVSAFILVMVLSAPFIQPSASAQSTAASVSGRVTDSSNAAVVGVEVEIRNTETGSSQTTQTNGAGVYSFPVLQPGNYLMNVHKESFRTVSVTGITLNVQDNLSRNFVLQVGSVTESITVTGDSVNVNTTDASVSTVIDQSYVQNMPLNGRSFQDLILLTPGVVTQSSQPGLGASAGGLGQSGEFSVNGQRTEENYYTVDGVSANVGTGFGTTGGGSMFLGTGLSGSVSASTASGTTQALVSVDDLQEFRVQSSTYSAEYGRNPGAQIAFETKSGINQWHGTGYDYVRNGFFDATDWFNSFYGLNEPALRQNDFGGTLGGPLSLPHLYDGKDKTFFFVSYEGLRLTAPQPAATVNVPDNALRASTLAPLQQVLNAWPVQSPNLPDDVANGTAQFAGSWSNPSSIDSTSVRFDHVVSGKHRLFFRFSDTESSTGLRATQLVPPVVDETADYTLRTYTGGATSLLTNRVSNDFRINYSSNEVASKWAIDAFGGNAPVDLQQMTGLGPNSTPGVYLVLPSGETYVSEQLHSGAQRQWNFVDTVSFSFGRHQLKFGADYRRLTPFELQSTPSVSYAYTSLNSIQTNNADFIGVNVYGPAYPLYANFSAFTQDEWKVSARLTLSLGLRWDVNPPPGVTQGTEPYTLQGTAPSNWTLAPKGTPLWRTTWFNFAPRLGAAYVLRDKQGWETVVRGGGGLFYDTGQQLGSQGFGGPGFTGAAFSSGPFPGPLPTASISSQPSIFDCDCGNGVYPHLQIPYTIQSNLSVQQALGKSQAVTLSYVGAHAAKLLQNSFVIDPTRGQFGLYFGYVENGHSSDYHSLQVQFQRRLSRGLTALGSYTWSHCIDYGSSNLLVGFVRGNCDFDVRNNFSAAISYDLPEVGGNGLVKALLHHWGFDDRLTARTGFPITLGGFQNLLPNGRVYYTGLDLVQNEPLYVTLCQDPRVSTLQLIPCPGGKGINPAAFAPPSGNAGTAPRNFLTGLGAWQMDLAVRREFPIYERLKLQFRAEAFNIFNHPSFGTINQSFCSPDPNSVNFQPGCKFGEATATLANSLGTLSPLYQMGGPRSMQFALKLIF